MDYTEFLEDIRQTRRQPTYENYTYALRNFPEGTKEEIINFISHNPNSDTTKKSYLRILGIALKYYGLLSRDISSIISSYRPDESLQECPTVEDIETVWKGLRCTRDRAMFALMTYMGLRVGEVNRLNLEDVTKDGRVILRVTKGHRPDILPIIHERVENTLRDYIKTERMNTDKKALFTGPNGRLDLTYVKNLFRKEFDDNGFPQYHCHSLRRFFANMMYNSGISLLDMQDNMRHKSAETTRRYINLGQQNRIEAMKRTWGNSVSRRFSE